MPLIDTIAIVLLAIAFCFGGLVGQQIERGWWRRNLLGQDTMPPGIRRRLGL